MRLVATHNRAGPRLAELVRESQLERPTVHRILQGLVGEGILVHDPASRRYFLGPLLFELGLAAASRFDLADHCRPALDRLAEQSADTVFLSVRSGLDSVCIDRREGSFPIKTFTLEVGARRPLGVGAGGMALLLPLAEDMADELLYANAARFPAYGGLTAEQARRMLQRSRALGYALNDAHSAADATTLALPITNRYGHPFAAISIGAISSRMDDARQHDLAAMLRGEIALIEKGLRQARVPGGTPGAAGPRLATAG